MYINHILIFLNIKNINSGTTRAGNVIGGEDLSENKLSQMQLKLEKNNKLDLKILFTRPWQHVLEPLSGYLKLAKYLNQGKYNEKFNLALV